MQAGDEAPPSQRLLRQPEPDVRPLGFIAVALAVLSLVLAATYFFSPFAYLSGALALALGFSARTVKPIRTMGTVAVCLATLAMLCATAVLVFGW